MKVNEVMTRGASVCELNASLADAAKTMWDTDCGVLPVVKDGKEIVGLITDRDICMAIAMKDRNPTAISVEEVINGTVYSIAPEDDIQKALETMREHRVRRLPVVGPEGKLEGMLSMNDLVLVAQPAKDKKAPAVTYAEVVNTYKAICAHPLPVPQEQQAQAAIAGA